MPTARVAADLADAAVAQAVAGALAAERDGMGDGARLAVAARGAVLHLDLEAADASTLRAVLHSALRLADAAARTAGAVKANG